MPVSWKASVAVKSEESVVERERQVHNERSSVGLGSEATLKPYPVVKGSGAELDAGELITPLSRVLGVFSGRSISERLADVKNRPSGFDYMRVILAFSVVILHSSLLCYGHRGGYRFPDRISEVFMHPFAMMILPMFFALSGFLVAGSLERSTTLISFLGLRVFRVVPALAVEVLLSALILGPIFTTESLHSYFTDTKFYSYFWNILGDIHYELPGVFQSNPLTIVNGQLWTVPWELASYIALTFLAVFGIFRRKNWLLIFMLGYYAVQVGNTILRPHGDATVAGGSTLVMSFVAGLVMYKFRDKIYWSNRLFLLSAIACFVLLLTPNGVRFVAIPAAYFTVYLGLLNPPKNRFILSGDYSYGIFLYGFPIQQAIIALKVIKQEWYWNLLAAVPCVTIVAIGSWWLVEKPVLERRKVLRTFEEWVLRKRIVWHNNKIYWRHKNI